MKKIVKNFGCPLNKDYLSFIKFGLQSKDWKIKAKQRIFLLKLILKSVAKIDSPESQSAFSFMTRFRSGIVPKKKYHISLLILALKSDSDGHAAVLCHARSTSRQRKR